MLLGMLLDQQVHDGVGVRAPLLLQAAARGGEARRRRDRGDGPGRPRGDLPRQARAAPLPGVDGEARARRSAATSSTTTTARADGLWNGAATGDELLARVQALPGFGKDKSRIFVGVLGKRLGVRPPGWETVAADWPSIADVDSFERVAEIREEARAEGGQEGRGREKRRRRSRRPRKGGLGRGWRSRGRRWPPVVVDGVESLPLEQEVSTAAPPIVAGAARGPIRILSGCPGSSMSRSAT